MKQSAASPFSDHRVNLRPNSATICSSGMPETWPLIETESVGSAHWVSPNRTSAIRSPACQSWPAPLRMFPNGSREALGEDDRLILLVTVERQQEVGIGPESQGAG